VCLKGINVSTPYPGPRGRQRAIQLRAAEANALLQSRLPYVLRLLTPAQIGQVQKVLDAAVVNPAVQKDYAAASRKNADAERARGVFSDGAVYRTPDSPQMRKLAGELIDVAPSDKHIRLEHPKLLAYDALKPLTDNPDEAAYLDKIMKTLSRRGVYLRIEPKLVHDADDKSRWIVSDRDFDVWLSLGYDGDRIPSQDGKLTRMNLLDNTTLGAGYYTDVIKGTVETRFHAEADRISRKIRDGLSLHEDQDLARWTAAPGVVTISDTLGGADYPSEKIWDQPWALLMQARDLNKDDGNIVAASKRLALAALLADLAANRLNQYINDTVKGASRAILVAKAVVVITSVFESALMIFSLATLAADLVAIRAAEAAAERAAVQTAKRKVRKEVTREMFDEMLKTGRSTFRRSAATENLRGVWWEDIQRIYDAFQKRGIELSETELNRLFEAAQAKWYGG
jgi:hypothetical protein